MTPTSASNRPSSAPMSSSSTTGSSGFFELRTKDHQLALPRSLLDSTTAVRSEKPSRTIPTSSTPMAHAGEEISWGWRSFSTPSQMAKSPPIRKSTIATTKAQK